MTRAIVTGSLHKGVEERTSKNGNPFATFTICETVNGATRWFRAVAFSELVIAAVRSLQAGEPLSVAGELDAEVYAPDAGSPRVSWSIRVDGALTAQPQRKSKKAVPSSETAGYEGGPSDCVPF
jgi:single-stranded DNA-binding protein